MWPILHMLMLCICIAPSPQYSNRLQLSVLRWRQFGAENQNDSRRATLWWIRAKISSPQPAQAEGNPPRAFRVSPGDRTRSFLFIRIPEVKVISPAVIDEHWMSILQTACLEYTGDVRIHRMLTCKGYTCSWSIVQKKQTSCTSCTIWASAMSQAMTEPSETFDRLWLWLWWLLNRRVSPNQCHNQSWLLLKNVNKPPWLW